MLFLSYMSHALAVYKIFFTSLANPHRLQIINSLRQNRRNVSEICEFTGMEQSMVSHNLKRLERCGMVFVEKKGKNRYYTLNHKTIIPLMKIIDAHMDQYCSKIHEGER
mgnify:FL=1